MFSVRKISDVELRIFGSCVQCRESGSRQFSKSAADFLGKILNRQSRDNEDETDNVKKEM